MQATLLEEVLAGRAPALAPLIEGVLVRKDRADRGGIPRATASVTRSC